VTFNPKAGRRILTHPGTELVDYGSPAWIKRAAVGRKEDPVANISAKA
jgi:hypothetical protein